MSLSYSLNRVYYKSDFYLFFGIIQIVLSFGLLGYLLSDFGVNFKKPFVIAAEVLIFVFMAIDVIIYNLVNEFRFTWFNLIEWSTLIAFILCFSTMLVNGVQKNNEQIELYLIVLRFVLQIVRLILSVARVTETSQKRKTATNIEIQVDGMQVSKEQGSAKSIEMVEI